MNSDAPMPFLGLQLSVKNNAAEYQKANRATPGLNALTVYRADMVDFSATGHHLSGVRPAKLPAVSWLMPPKKLATPRNAVLLVEMDREDDRKNDMRNRRIDVGRPARQPSFASPASHPNTRIMLSGTNVPMVGEWIRSSLADSGVLTSHNPRENNHVAFHADSVHLRLNGF